MNNIKEFFYYMIGRVPADLREEELKGKKLLHISDTPSSFFGELARLIGILKPDYIVHTGDLVDNIKLGLYPGSLWRYERDVKHLIKLLEESEAEKLYISLGNHDDFLTLKKLCCRVHIIKESEIVNIEGSQFFISHYSTEVLKNPAAFNLFGHDLAQKTGVIEGHLFLNGISNINLVELESLRYHCYPYPAGTDNARLGKGKIGL
jgi:predicted MPP superfamily phosphohydrolase